MHVNIFAQRRPDSRIMFLLTCLIIIVVVHEKTIAAQVLPTNLFGTKNSYNASLELWKDEPAEVENGNIRDCCQPIQLTGVYRHGMRYPTRKDLDNMADVLNELKSRGAYSETLGRLQSVLTAFENAGPGEMADSGLREQYDLGRRAVRRQPDLFRTHPHLAFFTSSSSRAVDSLRSFQLGLAAELDRNVSVPMSSEERDDLLRFHERCPRYTARVKQNQSAFYEMHKYRQNAYPVIRRRLARQLKVDELTISDDQLDSWYNVAGIELAVANSSHWASLLSSDDLPLLEYATDLKQYYKLGYGYAINKNISCPLISHIFQQMDQQIRANRSVVSGSASFYIGHSTTILPLFAALGLFRDPQPLTAAVWNSSSTIGDRQFRTSRIDPMSSNIAFTLHDCAACRDRGRSKTKSSSNGQNAIDQYVLRLDVSERAVNWPVDELNQAGVVDSYSDVRRAYSAYIDHCRFKEQCTISVASSRRTGILYIIMCSVAVTAYKELFHMPL